MFDCKFKTHKSGETKYLFAYVPWPSQILYQFSPLLILLPLEHGPMKESRLKNFAYQLKREDEIQQMYIPLQFVSSDVCSPQFFLAQSCRSVPKCRETQTKIMKMTIVSMRLTFSKKMSAYRCCILCIKQLQLPVKRKFAGHMFSFFQF